MYTDRKDAGEKLTAALKKYAKEQVIVYALPRGGVVVAKEIADVLHAPLDLIFARKIGHPFSPEFARAAISESGFVCGEAVDNQLLMDQLAEIKRRRTLYLSNRPSLNSKGKIAILVDDGVATGLTMEAGILELQSQHPKKIIVAVPVSPKDTFERLKALAGDAVCPEVTDHFLGAVGAYYHEFPQVEDSEVISILKDMNVHL